MNSILLKETKDKRILRLTLNDTARRNALSEEMLDQLHAAIGRASANDTIRVIILAANGRAFSAGHDLKELTKARSDVDKGRDYFTKIMQKCSRLMQTIVCCDKPVIAEVEGVATAAGCQLVASCDLALAADTARFSTPGVHIGLFCSTPMVALSRTVSKKHAMEMLLTGKMISADEAASIGLINYAVPLSELRNKTMEIAQHIASKSMKTISIGKQAFNEQTTMSLSDAYDFTSKVMVDNMMTFDAEEGINAFLDKRDPDWQDK